MFKRAGVFWCCIRHNGRKIQKSLETSDRKLAQAIEAKVFRKVTNKLTSVNLGRKKIIMN